MMMLFVRYRNLSLYLILINNSLYYCYITIKYILYLYQSNQRCNHNSSLIKVFVWYIVKYNNYLIYFIL